MATRREEPSIGPIKQFGRYTLISRIATGGMAEIWLARQDGVAQFTRLVVVKKILSHLVEDEAFRTMFLDEARVTAHLTHPNIVQVHDLGEAEGTYFMAMELVQGQSLASVASLTQARRKRLVPAFGARVIADAAKGLHYAHTLKRNDGTPLNLVHRDVSPQNVLVTYEGEVKVIDFGIAKATTNVQRTQGNTIKGKFSYMSPEQCVGGQVDRRSDIFALGILLWELCTGRRLFKHDSELVIMEMITGVRITPPSQIIAGFAPELEQIIMRAMERAPEDRFQTAQEMQVALEEYLRRDATPSSNADVAAHMRGLFAAQMEEQRQLWDRAMKLEAPVSFDEEPTEQAQPVYRPVSARGSPVVRSSAPPPGPPKAATTSGGRVMMSGVALGTPVAAASSGGRRPITGSQPSPARLTPSRSQLTPARAQPAPSRSQLTPARASRSAPGVAAFPTQGLGPQLTPLAASRSGAQSLTWARPDDSRRGEWLPRVVIGISLVITLAALGLMVRQFAAPAKTLVGEASGAQSGRLAIRSVPPGALVTVNGRPAPGAGSTPTELLMRYGERVELKLELEGYVPLTQILTMEPRLDGQTMALQLAPRRVPTVVPVAQ